MPADATAAVPSASPPAAAATQALDRLALVAPFVLLALLSLHTVWAVDACWQFAAGRQIAADGPPSVDTLSVAGRGRPWIELRWLYCLGLYELVDRFGWPAAVVVKTVLVLTAFGLVTALAGGGRRPLLAGGVVFLAAVASGERLLLRPEILTFLWLAAELAVLERYRRSGDRRWLLALPAIQMAWVNTHTLFVLGPVVVALFWAAVAFRRWVPGPSGDGGPGPPPPTARLGPTTLALVATVGACLVNPWGLRGFFYPVQLWRELHAGPIKDRIVELQSSLAYLGISPAVWAAAALAVITVAVAVASRRRLDPFWTVLCAAFLYLAVTAVRNLPLFALVAVPFVLLHAPPGPRRSPAGRRRSLLPALAAGALLALCGWLGWQQVTDRWQADREEAPTFGLSLAPHRFPTGAVDYLLRSDLGGEPVFATFKESSYLLARGFEVYLDPRLEVFGEALLAHYFAMLDDPAALERTLAASGVRVAVVDLASAAVNTLRTGGRWRLVHFDETAAVLVRYELPAAADAILDRDDYAAAADAVARRLGAPPVYDEVPWWRPVPQAAPYWRTARFLAERGLPDLAEPFARWARQATPGGRGEES